MLYSQVNYLGSFLPFSQVHHLSFSKPIEKFVNGNLKVSNSRLYTEVKNGGLGLVRMADFLNCQKCGWLPLTKTSTKNGNLTFLRVMGGKWDQHTNLNSPPTQYCKALQNLLNALETFILKKTKILWKPAFLIML